MKAPLEQASPEGLASLFKVRSRDNILAMLHAFKLPANEIAALFVAISFAAGLNVYATVATLGLLSHA